MTNEDFDIDEFCDDGNTDDGDGCTSICEVEPLYTCEGGDATTPDTCFCWPKF